MATYQPDVSDQPYTGQSTGIGGNNLGPTSQAAYNNMQGYWNALQPYLGQVQGQAQQQIGQLQGQVPLTLAESGYQQDYLNQSNQIQQSLLGLQGQSLGIDQAAIQRALGYNQQQYGITQQQYGLQGQSLDQQQEQLQYQAGRDKQNLAGSMAARGASQGQGFRDQSTDLAKQLQWSMQNLGRSRQQLSLEQQASGISFQQQQQSLQDQQKKGQLTADRLGIDKKDLDLRLSNALNQLGLSTQLSVGDIYTAMDQVRNGEYSQLAPFLSQIYQMTGVGPFG